MKLFIILLLSSLVYQKTSAQGNPGSEKHGEKPLFSFGIIADVQYSDNDPAGSRFYRSSAARLRESIKTFREESVNFIINLGDLIDRDFKSYNKVMGIIDSSGIPVYHVCGNHDFAVESQLKDRLPQLKYESGYYSIIKQGFRLIFLDGNEISTYATDNEFNIKEAEKYLDSLKANDEINSMNWNGGMSNLQLEWLDKQLIEAVTKDEKVLISCHFPVFPENVHNMLNYKDVLLKLNNHHNIIAWFNGHNHAGNYGVLNRIHYITFRGMVETERFNSYAIADVYRDKIIIRGFGREDNRVIEY